MLTRDELILIEENYSLELLPEKITYMPGGDVNEAYQVQSATNSYLLKKIELSEYARVYKATQDEIKTSLSFSEDICRKQQQFGNVVPALKGKSGVFVESKNYFYMLFPYVDGSVIENLAIDNEMISRISHKLFQMHHGAISYDQDFSKHKSAHFLEVAHTLVENSYWAKLDKVLNYFTPFEPIKKITRFILDSQDGLEQSINALSLESVCHNDLKPKNVLWNKDKDFWIIDWEAACDFDHRADYLDTLLAWCIEENARVFTINPDKVIAFQGPYYIAPEELHHAMNIVILKWYFWLYFCLLKGMQHPTRIPHYAYHAKIALGYLNLLIDKRDLSFLVTRK
ncbi:phosphotransferase [Legionella maioricensis]|uniref:Phosphotransferase n=1 Tax=Legionella maioricensis TaxID=2896528 RepID=A0A9X2I9X8_9GAMM|nr:phosphotransferase [Legionella maioricensis]MCL9683046.1 phosphotransferase [Legionella maioricensis]MCL9686394.1 phosphotransferase [Legionella maioricensis]